MVHIPSTARTILSCQRILPSRTMMRNDREESQQAPVSRAPDCMPRATCSRHLGNRIKWNRLAAHTPDFPDLSTTAPAPAPAETSPDTPTCRFSGSIATTGDPLRPSFLASTSRNDPAAATEQKSRAANRSPTIVGFQAAFMGDGYARQAPTV